MINPTMFKNLRANRKKLMEFGFKENGGVFEFSQKICDDSFEVRFAINNAGEVFIDVFEISSKEKFDLFYVKTSTSAFVEQINSACVEIAKKIIINCFEKDVFKSEQSKQVIEYVRKTYGDELEFLWEKFSDNAIWRRKDNRKWYALLLVVSKNKLKINSDEKVEILDVRADKTKVSSLIDNKQIFEGYHMNKKSWITIPLDNSMPIEKIFTYIDASYILAKKE